VEFAVFERKLDVEYASVLNENPVLFVYDTCFPWLEGTSVYR
jgi:hypothetical protein